MTVPTVSMRDVVNHINKAFVQTSEGTFAPHKAKAPVGSSIGVIPKTPLESLGSQAFCEFLNIRYPYLSGAMANGIASEALVASLVKGEMGGFFGAAGLSPERVAKAIATLRHEIDAAKQGSKKGAYGFNLIHSPQEPHVEDAIVSLYLKEGINLVEASAFMGLTLPLVRYRVTGIHQNEAGDIVTPQKVIAKVSRTEVAQRFLSPPPEKLLKQLLEQKVINEHQMQLALKTPMADAITVEADSGGHTDNRPFVTLIPTMLRLAAKIKEAHQFKRTAFVGAAGGIATPESALAAFAMGASYIVTGSVNQACIESGSCDTVRTMLAQADQADIAMAPAADMFEMGVKVQVLKRGSMFPMRAKKLYDLYTQFPSIEAIPDSERETLETTFFKKPLTQVWSETCDYFAKRDPKQIEKAERDPRHKMALIFRSYLGQSSHWANRGEEGRKFDYQIWCGPAMGAFNEWTKDSFLAQPEQRDAVTVAMNILYGAARIKRMNYLHDLGVMVDDSLRFEGPWRKAEMNDFFL